MMNIKVKLHELGRQQMAYERRVINLIASDNAKPANFSNEAPYDGHMIQEGVLNKRPFAGAKIHDQIEQFAAQIACSVFQADHANLQPHSCSQANQAVYHALLKSGDSVVALKFQAGGHLTHGLSKNFSGKRYKFSFFGMNEAQDIDYAELHNLVTRVRPKLIVCGSSACPKLFDVHRLRAVANSVGARLMLDLSHEAGLIAGKVIPNPIPHADIVTLSLDKTLRGPFGGAILCRSEFKTAIDNAVHPGTQSSFPIRKLFDAASALLEAETDGFRDYAARTIANAQTFARIFREKGLALVSGGTEKHYVIVDTSPFGLSGTAAEERLESIDILSSRQTLPHNTSGRMSEAGGIRLGTAWISSRGYGEADAKCVAQIISDALTLRDDDSVGLSSLRQSVQQVVKRVRPADVWGSSVFECLSQTEGMETL